MNYLAHLYLSPNQEDIKLGSLLGDFVKGPIQDNGTLLNRAIILHRKLDTFTDNNPIIKRSKKNINNTRTRYAGIIIDIFYDYFLAKNWSTFHHTPLRSYAQKIYQMLEKRQSELPENLLTILPQMIKNDWLSSYAHKQKIEVFLAGIGQRLKKPVALERSIIDLCDNYSALENDFFAFMPLAKQFCCEYAEVNFQFMRLPR